MIWFATFIALAVDEGTDNGSKGDAAAAFGFFAMIVWIVLAVVFIMNYRKLTSGKSENSDPV
jgi:threonine/homoserine/homoserine lactone efflux protein